MASVAKLVVELEANIAKFSASFDQAVAQTQRATAKITSSLKKIAAFSLAGLSVGKIISDLKAVGDEAKALEKISIRFNIDPQQFSAMQYAAQKAGVEVEIFNRSVQFMAKNISNAALGIEEMVVTEDGLIETSNKAGQSLQELGLNIQAMAKMPLDVQLKAIIGSLYSMEDESRRVAVALDIFGKSGGKMATVGAEGLAKFIENMEKGRETGKAWTDEQLADALESQKAISKMSDSWGGLRRELVLLAGPLSTIFDLVTWILQKFLMARTAINAFGDSLYNAARRAAAQHGGAYFEAEPEEETPVGIAGLPAKLEKRLRNILAAGRAYEELREQYPELFGEKGRPAKTKGGGAGGTDPFEQLAKTLESLQTEKLSLIGTEFQKIDDWVRKTLEDIQQWGDLGELTAQAIAEAVAISAEKKKSAESDFLNWVAEQTGDYAATIAKQIDDLAKKWKNMPGAMQAFEDFRAKEMAKKGSEFEQNRLNLTKQFIEELGNASPLLSEQLRYKEQALAIDIQIGRERLKLLQFEPWMTDELWQQSNALAAQVEKSRELALVREKLMLRGPMGGLQAYALQRQKEAETRPAEMVMDTLRALEQEMAQGLSNAIINALRGKQADMSEIFFSMADSALRRAIGGLTALLFDQAMKPIATPLITAGTLNVATINAGAMGGALLGGGFGALAGYENAALGGYELPGGFEAMADYMNDAMGEFGQLGNNINNFYATQNAGWANLLGLSGGWLEQLFNTIGNWFGSLLKAFGGGGDLFGGIGGFFGDLFGGIGGLFGFQHGGSFIVPGSGGPDSQLVAFKATPGEQVEINRPWQEDERKIVVNVQQTFITQDVTSFKASRTQLAAQAALDMQKSFRNM